MYASFKACSFLKVTDTGYIHGAEIYGAIDIQVTYILKPIDEGANGLYWLENYGSKINNIGKFKYLKINIDLSNGGMRVAID